MYENEVEMIALRCNKAAMDYLGLNKFKESLSLLQRAELLLNSEEQVPNRLKLLSITFNNLGCYYKKKKQLNMALKYLKDSLEIEMQTEPDNLNLASNHLNICAILSSLGKHKKACAHAKQALALLKLFNGYNPNFITNLVIAYFNCGAELEHLLQHEEALKFYELGYEISNKDLGTTNCLTQNLSNAITKITVIVKNNKAEKNHKGNVNRGFNSIGDIPNKLPFIPLGRIRKSFVKNNTNRMNRTMNSFLY